MGFRARRRSKACMTTMNVTATAPNVVMPRVLTSRQTQTRWRLPAHQRGPNQTWDCRSSAMRFRPSAEIKLRPFGCDLGAHSQPQRCQTRCQTPFGPKLLASD